MSPSQTLNTSIAEVSTPTAEQNALRKAAISSFIGNFVEWFDYAAYGYLAAVIAKVFFPAQDTSSGLIAAFAVFALSFIVRPFGGMIWGFWGDRYGRKFALSWSIMLMSVATFCIALLPTYQHVGMAAPVLLLLVRLVQGFSASGEYAGASSFLAEYAPANKRGLYTSLVPASTATGLLVGSLLAAGLHSSLNETQLHEWGWRLPFLCAAPLGLVGRYIRLNLQDTPAFLAMEEKLDKQQKQALPIKTLFQLYRKEMLVACGAVSLNAVAFYTTLSYMPTYLSAELHIAESTSFLASSIALVAYIAFIFLMGYFSDVFGRKTMLMIACLMFIVFSVPLFMLLENLNFSVMLFVMIAFGMMLAINDGTLPCFLTELFPTSLRFSGFALCFNAGNALLGGTAPLVATLMIQYSDSALAPAWYLVAVSVVALVAILCSRNLKMEE